MPGVDDKDKNMCKEPLISDLERSQYICEHQATRLGPSHRRGRNESLAAYLTGNSLP